MKSRLIPLAFATILGWPEPSPAAQPGSELRSYLTAQCVLHAADAENPWALAHGITGVGKSHTAADGSLAHAAIVSKFVIKGADPKAGAFGFARFTQGGTPVEPHSNLLTKTFVLAGLPRSHTWITPHGKVTLGALIESTQKSFRHVPENAEYWHGVAWTLDLFGHVLTPAKAKFVNGAGETVDFNRVMDDALTALEQLQADIAQGMDTAQPIVAKRKQGIYAHSCGGLHLVQAVLTWGRHPEVRKRWGKRLERQIDVLFYRLDSERRQYEGALAQAPQQYRLQILVQMLKFYGHFLETTGRLEQEKVVKLNAERKLKVEKSRALLDATVRDLQQMQAFETLESIRKSQPQVALDLIGDGCHAANGLALTEIKKAK